MASLVLELLSGEIPMSMQKKAAEGIGKNIVNAIIAYYENYGDFHKDNIVVSYDLYSARRISLFIDYLPSLHSELILVKNIIKGPKISCDDEVLTAFMRKYEITSKDALMSDGINYIYHQKIHGKKAILEDLGMIIRNAITSYKWEKSMRWGSYELEWVRPLYSVLCMYDEDIIPFMLGHLHSSNKTVGHRIYNSDVYISPVVMTHGNLEALSGCYFGDCITLSHSSDYVSILERYNVIISNTERVECIRNAISAIIPDGTSVIEDEVLLHINSAITEFPTVLLGTIPEKYMSLPKEVLITTIKHHQRCMMLEYDSGDIAPYFIIVNDIISAHYDVDSVIRGNEKVVQARLEDASFIFLKECNAPLELLINKLKELIFHEKIGSMYQKVERMKDICVKLCDAFRLKDVFFSVDLNSIEKACFLSKVDLTTEMVREFPELQGVIGAYYAKMHGESDEVVTAIKEHYHPLGRGDKILPTSALGVMLSLSDRLDTLNQMFAIGIRPSSTKDPYALRRAAISINRILECNNIVEYNIMREFIRKDVIEFLQEKR